MNSLVLSVKNISQFFGSFQVLKNVSIDIHQGDVVAILGKSGAGKTTLLRTMNLLIEPESGDIFFRGQKVSRKKKVIRYVRSRIGFVFQNFNLISHLTALDNVALGLVKVKGMKWSEAREIAARKLSDVHLSDKLGSYPSQLSGGQKQRVGIARALAMEPDLILFDEPTSALDPSLVGEVMGVIKELSTRGITMVVVTHEIAFAKGIANRIVFMEDGQIVIDTSPKEFFDSSSEKIREFLDGILCGV
ncbi:MULTISPECIES: amino acid ABC transporter ATP-binding protein [Kosmotoga]|uniref:ABC transporter related n=1 Tax=Kosmotoga olearia (strain ATCC BAA-1733 / DSM 21960 / TBF 19.5.1) TaxID=521045 RepID=C5CFF3_KOSOT|nr:MULTISPECIES: amino acid ABC transporter ATP-binding protein [Kosmotoga]ACR80362.1 ABC transporter related [Kosmotoga olearia TBF 19.5.1]MDI3523796.1 polar amino acid transport system ATP-binding protein [Kosmotoga sp.]MDK2953340.1 polar amino acid transport system ATP-binding protein [Kosmotoga sp.]OAA19980.1 ABC transporter [Kosmotoga sp. DU53]